MVEEEGGRQRGKERNRSNLWLCFPNAHLRWVELGLNLVRDVHVGGRDPLLQSPVPPKVCISRNLESGAHRGLKFRHSNVGFQVMSSLLD